MKKGIGANIEPVDNGWLVTIYWDGEHKYVALNVDEVLGIIEENLAFHQALTKAAAPAGASEGQSS